MNKKLVIGIIALVLVIIGGVAFIEKQSLEKVKLSVTWNCMTEKKQVYITVWNDGRKSINVTRVELIYLPDETLGLIWFELRTIGSEGAESYIWQVLEGGIEEEYQLECFNLLLEGEDKVRIEVETPKAIYTFYPNKWKMPYRPTSIEKK